MSAAVAPCHVASRRRHTASVIVLVPGGSAASRARAAPSSSAAHQYAIRPAARLTGDPGGLIGALYSLLVRCRFDLVGEEILEFSEHDSERGLVSSQLQHATNVSLIGDPPSKSG